MAKHKTSTKDLLRQADLRKHRNQSKFKHYKEKKVFYCLVETGAGNFTRSGKSSSVAEERASQAALDHFSLQKAKKATEEKKKERRVVV